MKKFLYMAVAAIAALSSCSNDDIVSNENGNGVSNANAPVFTATIEGEVSTRTQLVEGSTAGKLTKVVWSDGDQININGSLYSTTSTTNTADFSLVDGQTAAVADAQSKYKAVYPASLYDNGALSLPASYTYAEGKFNMPMYAENTETSLGFKNICAVLAVTVPSTQMTAVSSITVSSDKQMNGAFTTTSAGVLTFADKTLEAADKKVTLTFSAAKAIATSETFYIAIPANTYAYLQIEVTDGTKTKYMRTKAASISVERNKIYPFTFAKNYDPNLLTGVFSVSATKKVQFTKGNLYWDGSAYQFEANQTAYPAAWNTSHVGLFFWNSYDEYSKTGDDAYTYKPYYSSYSNLNRTTSDVFWCGEAHPLEVAGTQGLYVLSAEEWYYLTGMYTYASYSNVRNETNKFALAMVNEKKGLLIFPDGYNGTTPVSDITGIAEVNNDYTAYPTESIDPTTWSTMEAAGVVFLPAAGYRGDPNGQTISSGYCQYWSSTPYDNSSAKDEEYAYGLFGTDTGDFKCPGKIQRKFGSSIRLVKTVE